MATPMLRTPVRCKRAQDTPTVLVLVRGVAERLAASHGASWRAGLTHLI